MPPAPDYLPTLSTDTIEAARKKALDRVNEKMDSMNIEASVELTREIREGIPARELADAAKEVDADLIILASHGRSALGRFFHGSVSGRLVRISHCPLLVVHEGHSGKPFDNVLVAVDLSSISGRLVEHAFAMASPEGTVRAVSAFEPPLVATDRGDFLPRYIPPEEIEALEGERKKAIEALMTPHKLEQSIEIDVVRKAPPANVILDVVQLTEPDLVVIGTSGHNMLHRMLIGSTATRVLAESRTPVLVVPFEG